MLTDVTIGQYYPSSSFIHKLDSRVKLLLLIAYIVMIFIVKNYYGFLPIVFLLIIEIAFSKVPFLEVLKGLRGILFLILFTVVLNLLFYTQGNTVYFEWKFIRLTKEGLIYTGFMASRLILLVLGATMLNLTTTPVSLTDGLESLLKPLKVIHFPVHEIALVMSIALRFIPILIKETNRIIMAQKARGANFDSKNPIKKIKALIPILIPLLISAFRRAEELGDAMDARCYSGSKNRTKYKKLKITYRDVVAIIVSVLLFTLSVLCNRFGVIV